MRASAAWVCLCLIGPMGATEAPNTIKVEDLKGKVNVLTGPSREVILLQILEDLPAPGLPKGTVLLLKLDKDGKPRGDRGALVLAPDSPYTMIHRTWEGSAPDTLMALDPKSISTALPVVKSGFLSGLAEIPGWGEAQGLRLLWVRDPISVESNSTVLQSGSFAILHPKETGSQLYPWSKTTFIDADGKALEDKLSGVLQYLGRNFAITKREVFREVPVGESQLGLTEITQVNVPERIDLTEAWLIEKTRIRNVVWLGTKEDGRERGIVYVLAISPLLGPSEKILLPKGSLLIAEVAPDQYGRLSQLIFKGQALTEDGNPFARSLLAGELTVPFFSMKFYSVDDRLIFAQQNRSQLKGGKKPEDGFVFGSYDWKIQDHRWIALSNPVQDFETIKKSYIRILSKQKQDTSEEPAGTKGVSGDDLKFFEKEFLKKNIQKNEDPQVSTTTPANDKKAPASSRLGTSSGEKSTPPTSTQLKAEQAAKEALTRGPVASLTSNGHYALVAPLDVVVYAGTIHSNLYRTKGDTDNKQHFGQKYMARLEATQVLFLGNFGRAYFKGFAAAMMLPASEVTSTTQVQEVIRTSEGVQGELAGQFGWVVSEHVSLAVGVGWKGNNTRFGEGTNNAPIVFQDRMTTQTRYFFRIEEHDPQWRGSFFEFSPRVRDPLYQDPADPDSADRRTQFRGRVAFRPRAFGPVGFYVDGILNRGPHGTASKLPDETTIQLGIRWDFKVPSFF